VDKEAREERNQTELYIKKELRGESTKGCNLTQRHLQSREIGDAKAKK